MADELLTPLQREVLEPILREALKITRARLELIHKHRDEKRRKGMILWSLGIMRDTEGPGLPRAGN